MGIFEIYSTEEIGSMAKKLFEGERARKRLDGWFLIKELEQQVEREYEDLPLELKKASVLKEVVKRLPLSIEEDAIFAGTQRDAFARSYALINPSFQVETFSGYCDPTAVFGDIEANEEFTRERIDSVCEYHKKTDYVRALNQVYDKARTHTSEVAYFIEQVTGHVIPDFQPALSKGVGTLLEEIQRKAEDAGSKEQRDKYAAMALGLESVSILAERYADLAGQKKEQAAGKRKMQLELMEATLRKVPKQGASNLYEAIQSFLLLWQLMCIEQAPNPYAFSVGNADRIFEPYRAMENLNRETSASLFQHFLVFFNVGDRSWAISQNILLSGKSVEGRDLTNLCTYAIMDAFYTMNLPQPIMSVRLHRNTPEELYESMGRFFFTAGCLTPSLFNDDMVFDVLARAGVEREDLEHYAVAGCQEPLIMGKDNGNTTNSWLNLAKILELTLNGGVSTISGETIGTVCEPMSALEVLTNIKELFYQNAAYYIEAMAEAANGASRAISLLPVPFLSAFMGGIESGYDMRDTRHQGTKYNGSGCLIHGLSVVADSFAAIQQFLKERPQQAEELLEALRTDFKGKEELRQFLLTAPKYGNGIEAIDKEAAEIAGKISDMVRAQKNYLGNPFRPDWSSPSTHLLYGYWVGATPDGRNAREMLGYGIDPKYGDAQQGLGFRVMSLKELPFEKMPGGCASHFGINPKYFREKTYEGKGLEFKKKVVEPLFFSAEEGQPSPFYLYVNVTTPDALRKLLEDPKKYAPSGVYIMRIHGTFVNFLDLSSAIQNDIIKRLDLESTAMC